MMPSRQVSRSSGIALRAYRSARPRTSAKTHSMVATIHRLRSSSRMRSWNAYPSAPIGSEPTMMSQPIRASGSPRGTLPTSDRAQARMIRAMSRAKNRTTAASVPSWVTAVKEAPGSFPVSSPTTRRCALEEMGRNSVRPWTMPRMTAST